MEAFGGGAFSFKPVNDLLVVDVLAPALLIAQPKATRLAPDGTRGLGRPHVFHEDLFA